MDVPGLKQGGVKIRKVFFPDFPRELHPVNRGFQGIAAVENDDRSVLLLRVRCLLSVQMLTTEWRGQNILEERDYLWKLTNTIRRALERAKKQTL